MIIEFTNIVKNISVFQGGRNEFDITTLFFRMAMCTGDESFAIGIILLNWKGVLEQVECHLHIPVQFVV